MKLLDRDEHVLQLLFMTHRPKSIYNMTITRIVERFFSDN